VAACRQGDPTALERVLGEYAPYLEGHIVRLVGPGADAEDLLQAALMAVVSAFPRYRGEASLKTWMTRIAINIVRQHWRKPERRRRAALEVVPERADDPAQRQDRVLGSREQLERLYDHLQSLGEKKRLAFVLHVFEGHSLEEVAALTGATRAATKSRVWWARRALLARAARDPALKDLVAPDDSDGRSNPEPSHD